MRRLPLAIVLLLSATEAGAQIRRGGIVQPDPVAWVSGGAALTQPFTVVDGTTGSRWAFGDGTQYSVSLEKQLNEGATIGLRATTAKVPLSYRGSTVTGSAVTTDADANVSQGFVTVHVASGRAFHSVFELSAGATVFSNFRARGTGDKLMPSSADTDFTFALGYGVGYNFSPRFAIDVVQDLTTVRHQSTGLGAGESSSNRIHGTRFVARLGLGG